MKKLNYVTLESERLFEKSKENVDTYEILKEEMNDVTLGVLALSPNGALDAWYDDEFLLNQEYKPTFVIKNSPASIVTAEDILICGKVLFCSSNEHGDTIDLSEKGQELLQTKFSYAQIGSWKVIVYKNY